MPDRMGTDSTKVEDLPKGDPSRPHCMVPIGDVDPAYLVQIDGKIRYQEIDKRNDPRASFWDIKRKPESRLVGGRIDACRDSQTDDESDETS